MTNSWKTRMDAFANENYVCNDEGDTSFYTGVKYGWEKSRQDFIEEIKPVVDGLLSISKNSCCENCQEAKLVALEALATYRKIIEG